MFLSAPTAWALLWYRTFGRWGNNYSAHMIRNSQGNLVLAGSSQGDQVHFQPCLLEVSTDTFLIPLLELYPDNQLTVYGRWGQEVYRAEGYHNGWAASDLSAGTYFYSLLLRRTSKPHPAGNWSRGLLGLGAGKEEEGGKKAGQFFHLPGSYVYLI